MEPKGGAGSDFRPEFVSFTLGHLQWYSVRFTKWNVFASATEHTHIGGMVGGVRCSESWNNKKRVNFYICLLFNLIQFYLIYLVLQFVHSVEHGLPFCAISLGYFGLFCCLLVLLLFAESWLWSWSWRWQRWIWSSPFTVNQQTMSLLIAWKINISEIIMLCCTHHFL